MGGFVINVKVGQGRCLHMLGNKRTEEQEYGRGGRCSGYSWRPAGRQAGRLVTFHSNIACQALLPRPGLHT